MSGVVGVFRDTDAVSRAVRELTAVSVPVDSIRVFVVDAQGRRTREVAVEDEAGALRGGLIGAGVGAAVGVVGVVALVAGLLGSSANELFGLADLAGALRVVAVCAIAGLPFGVILGMGRWDARRGISEAEIAAGRVEVLVASERLAPVARRVLTEAGAERVDGGGLAGADGPP